MLFQWIITFEFSEMDAEIAQRKAEFQKIQEQLKREIKVHTEVSFNLAKETKTRNNQLVQLLNDQLETLRLQFQFEEVGKHPDIFKENIAERKAYCCCQNCLVEVINQGEKSCCSRDLQQFLHVQGEEQFEKKLDLLKRRQDGLQSCNGKEVCCSNKSCAMITKCINDDLTICCTNCTSCNCSNEQDDNQQRNESVFFILTLSCFPIPCIMIFFICLMPAILVWNCCAGIFNCCYRRGTRTEQVFSIYQKYAKMILSPRERKL